MHQSGMSMLKALIFILAAASVSVVPTPSDAQQPDSLVEDAQSAARWVADNLSQSGYRADFSLKSVWDIERFFDDHAENGKARPDGLLAEDTGARLFSLGAYLGEVWQRAGNGTWQAPETGVPEELRDFEFAIVFPNGVRGWPGRAVLKRFRDGKDDNDLVAYSVMLMKEAGVDKPIK